ncbi:glycoside hydrolase family 36 protein [Bifidobacterium cuniculi]|uniref:Alpha-galactosidase n=1 Tax=Bifidobacterium cuniculi TaxID=1688 RepID=A0A087AZQ7_9BIFI|nr:glycoside hydrolase family 36 protein [Bifidobacterium cuniculi]KFI64257.1 alpha-galactosidase [Bifidobacterium cuniculi]
MREERNAVEQFEADLAGARRVAPDTAGRIAWGNGVVTCVFEVHDDAPVTLVGLSGRGMMPARVDIPGQPDAQPIVELRSSIDGGADNHQRLAVSAAGLKLRFEEARVVEPADPDAPDATWRLAIVQRSTDERGPVVTSLFEVIPGHSAVRCRTRVHCDDQYPVEAVSSMNVTLPMAAARLDDSQALVYCAQSSWCLENAWTCQPLRATALRGHDQLGVPSASTAHLVFASSSTWSTGEFLPTGIISGVNEALPDSSFSFMWQIEHNGAWEWEIGENNPGLRVTAYGPEYVDHQWFSMMGEGNDFVTVPVSFVICAGDWQRAVAEMTVQRRALRQRMTLRQGRTEQFDAGELKVVYNDYMNTVEGSPNVELELPLVDGAAKAGADVFCIDIGWFVEDDDDWWSSVGDWEPSIDRFGIVRMAGIIHDITAHGMQPGLWLEPEIVGVHSPVAKTLPDSAFFCRHGRRVADYDRYHLDFRSPLARAHATAVVERLIDEFGIRYFKFDCNTVPGAGTDVDTDSVGAGLLEHCRAVQQWIDGLRRRHPDVMIENAAAGAMRADYAMLSRLDLQSASDQSDPHVFAAIAAGAGLAVLPEQQGDWAVVQEDMDDEQAVFALVSGVLGRLYLSGFLNRLPEPRMRLVRQAVALHREILEEQGHLVPWWPYGLPDFNGPWLAYGLRHDAAIAHDVWPAVETMMADREHSEYLAVWRRSGTDTMFLQLGEDAHITQVFPDPARPEDAPGAKPWTIEQVDPTTVRLVVPDDDEPSARVFKVSYGEE